MEYMQKIIDEFIEKKAKEVIINTKLPIWFNYLNYLKTPLFVLGLTGLIISLIFNYQDPDDTKTKQTINTTMLSILGVLFFVIITFIFNITNGISSLLKLTKQVS